MTEDERVIRQLVETWMEASRAGDVATVLSLMTDDVVFMVPGREPFGREVFEAATTDNSAGGAKIDGTNDIVELQVLGSWAFTRNHIDIEMTLPNGETMQRSGYTLSLYRKEADGHWRLMRDANLLAAKG
jgi:uncharacterized protein (TIGR02246 family)